MTSAIIKISVDEIQKAIPARYRVESQIAFGGEAYIYRVYDRELKRSVALKLIQPEIGFSVDTAQHEFRILSKLHHPNIVRVLDFGVLESGMPFITQEFVRGVSITEHFQHHFILDEFISIISDICEGLQFLHRNGVVHGDLKPENILVLSAPEKDSRVKLIDFGMSHLTDSGASHLSGTAEYISPEQIRGLKGTEKSDLYSLGVILFEIIYGSLPFRGSSINEIFRNHLVQPIPVLPLYREVPDHIVKLIKRLLVKDASVRIASAEQAQRVMRGPEGSDISIVQETPKISSATEFIGREQERTQFRNFLSRNERVSIFHLVGGHGVGKSRLLDELRVHLQMEMWDTVRVSGRTFSEATATLFLRDFLQKQFYLGIISRQVFENISTQIHEFDSQPSVVHKSDSERLRWLFDYTIDQINDSQHPHDVAYLFDDADLLNEQIRDFIEHLIRVIRHRDGTRNLFLLATSGKQIPIFVADVPQIGIELAPLASDETKQLIQSMFGSSVDDEVQNRLVHLSSGNPYELIEYVRFLADQHHVIYEHTKWIFSSAALKENILPASLEQLAEKRLETISGLEKNVIDIISLSRIPLPFHIIIACLDHQSEASIEEAFSRLRQNEIVLSRGHGYTIPNAALKTFVADHIESEKRKSLRTRIAEQLAQSSIASYVEEAGYQFDSSDRKEQAGRYYLCAAEEYHQQLLIRKAQSILEDITTRFDSVLDKEMKIHAREKLLRVYRTIGEYQSFAEVAEDLTILLREHNDQTRLASLLVDEAEIFAMMGQVDRAQRVAEKGLHISETEKIPLTVASAHVQLGQVHYQKGNFLGAIQEYDQGILLYSQHGEAQLAARTLLNAGYAATFSESPQKGITYFEQAQTIFTKLEDEYGRARALGNLGAAYYLLGKYQRALDVRLEANDIFTKLHEKRGQANAEVSIGKVLTTMGKYSESERHLLKALQLMREIGDQLGIARCYENLGLLGIDTGRYEFALTSFRKAQDIARRLDNNAMLAVNYQNCADTFLAQKNISLCEKELRYAEEFRGMISDNDVLINLDITKFMFLLARAEEADVREASVLCERLISLIDGEANNSHHVWIMTKKAELFLLLGDPYGAYAASNAAVEKLLDAKYSEWPEQEILYIHSNVCRTLSKPAEAHEYLQRAYDELQRKAELCADANVRKSFLESVPVNATIVEAFALSIDQPIPREQVLLTDRSLNALYKVAATINSILELHLLLPRILDLAIETMQGERGMMFLLEGNELSLQVARNVDRETIADATEISESVIHDVVQFGKPLIVEDAQQHSAFRSRQSVRNFHITSIICVPLRLKEKIIGTVYIDRRKSFQPMQPDPTLDLQFLEAFANLAAIAIENARLHKRLQEENQYLRQQVEEQYGFANIIGNSRPMREMYRLIKGAMHSESPVLITGESGTGKEVVARAIHYNGIRREKKFIAVDCGALPETLLESELFGHVKGAYTGAFADRVGLFEEADGGTIFLDEITNTTPAFQSRLLRVLQEGEIRRVGESSIRHINIRIIAATNRPIGDEVNGGRFRQDLFYRLNVIPIHVPPLRYRREDIPALIQHFISKYALQSGKTIKGISEDLLNELVQVEWNGNVRELENVMNRLIIFSDGEILHEKLLHTNIFPLTKAVKAEPYLMLRTQMSSPGNLSLREIDKQHILDVLKETKGNKTEAAKKLELKRTTLLKKMKKLGLM